jgi:hypothetical protein
MHRKCSELFPRILSRTFIGHNMYIIALPIPLRYAALQRHCTRARLSVAFHCSSSERKNVIIIFRGHPGARLHLAPSWSRGKNEIPPPYFVVLKFRSPRPYATRAPYQWFKKNKIEKTVQCVARSGRFARRRSSGLTIPDCCCCCI